ncbi:MAG: hypothetical protein GY715_18620 [Planctomycetes bacterium]|nr:hypothetical protein [Planctomycetota bacterium]
MNRSRCLLAALVIGASVAEAPGAITVTRSDGSPALPEEASITLNPVSGGWDVTLLSLYLPGGETVYTVTGDGGVHIDNIYIDVPCWPGPGGECVPAGSPVYVHVLSAEPGGIYSIGNVEQRGTAETLLLNVQAEQDIGSIQAEIIGTIVAGRDITGPIVSTTPDHDARGIFWVEARRDILGDVLTPNGRIGRVWAYRNMGSPDAPIRIEARHYINGIFAAPGACVQEWIAGNEITCAGDVYADINTRVNGGLGRIFRFLAGTFHGRFETRTIMADAATGTPGSMAVTEFCEADFVLGRSFANPAQWIELPPQGFTGQVVINADNIFGGQWTSPIHLGAASSPFRVTIVGPNYTQSTAALGGGSIGLVPFGLHLAATTPRPGEVVPGSAPGAPFVAYLQHYGPVLIDGPVPIIVERRPLNSTGIWIPLSPADFSATIDPADANVVRVTAAANQAGFAPGFEYRLSTTAQLRCDVPGTPPVQWAWSHSFGVDVADSCPADFNDDGIINMGDVIVLIGYWGPSPGSPGDLDGDGHVGFRDLLRVIGAWGVCQ